MQSPEFIRSHNATSSVHVCKKCEGYLCPRGFDIGPGIISPSYFWLHAESNNFCPAVDCMKKDSRYKSTINTVSSALEVW